MQKRRSFLLSLLALCLTAALFAAGSLGAGRADGVPRLTACLIGTAFLLCFLLLALFRANQKQK